jgi:serralysin
MGVWTPGPGSTTGDDTLDGDNTNETASGGDGNDTLNGAGGNDTLNGDDGADILNGGLGVDTVAGGLGNDSIQASAGADTITDFDADASGGQDLINISALGINSGDFGARVVITDLGSDTLITIDGSVTITLTGVTGDANNVITQSDFILGP